MKVLSALLLRETRLLIRQRAEAAGALLFCLLVITLFPFALSPAPDLLERLAPGLLNLVVLLALMLGLEKLFVTDWQDGLLDQLVTRGVSLRAYVLVKALALWLGVALPLLLVSPLFMLLLHVPFMAMGALLMSLLLGTGIISLIGTGSAALALGARRAGLLLPLLLVPLYVPVMIFAVNLAAAGLDTGEGRQSALFLAAMFFLYLTLVPFLGKAALKAAVESA